MDSTLGGGGVSGRGGRGQRVCVSGGGDVIGGGAAPMDSTLGGGA